VWWVTGPSGNYLWRGLVGGSTTFPDYFAFGMLTNPTSITELKKIMLTSPHLVLGSPVLGMT
jgi:hypothetical protein